MDAGRDAGLDGGVDAGIDAGVDAGPSVTSCPDLLGEPLLAHYPFTGGAYTDVVGGRDATPLEGAPTSTPGPASCEDALLFSGGQSLVIADDLAWELPSGSISMRVRFDNDDWGALLVRDAAGANEDGHFLLVRSNDGRLILRVQQSGAGSDPWRCSAPVSTGEWHDIVIQFGPPNLELYVDGVRATRTATTQIVGTWFAQDCGLPTTAGIAGNRNPWILGASNHQSDDGALFPTEAHISGAIDDLRISSSRGEGGS